MQDFLNLIQGPHIRNHCGARMDRLAAIAGATAGDDDPPTFEIVDEVADDTAKQLLENVSQLGKDRVSLDPRAGGGKSG